METRWSFNSKELDPSIHASITRNSERRRGGGKMSNRVSLVGNYVDPGRHKGRVTKRGREKGREGVLSGKVANEVRGWTRYAYEAWSSSSKNREKEEEGGREKGGRGDLLTRGRIGWRVKDGAEKWRWRSVGEDGVALRTLLWKLRMWFRFPREQVSYSRSTPLFLFPGPPWGAHLSSCPPFFTHHSRRRCGKL